MRAMAPAGVGGIDIWYRFTEAMDSRELDDAVALLDPLESARHDHFVSAADRRDYAAAHAMLRRALSHRYHLPPAAWRFETSASGKPKISATAVDAALEFSLSHTRGAVACAVGEHADIGVDVEALDGSIDVDALARQYFSPREQQDLTAEPLPDRGARFIELWSLKEAYVKAIGIGLSRPLDSFAFRFPRDGALGCDDDDPCGAARWQFALLALGENGGYRLALAVSHRAGAPHQPIRVHHVGARELVVRCAVRRSLRYPARAGHSQGEDML